MAAPPPDLTVSEWADKYRRLSAEASAEPGQWDTSRAEYQRGIMDAFNDPSVETVVVMSSAQVGKTEIINNVVGYYIDQDPSPILVVQPTETIAEAWSKDRLAPMLRDTPCLKHKVKDPKSRNSGNTLLHKVFSGGHITMVGSNAPAGLAGRPIRIVLDDEVDRYPTSAGSEGDPVSLAKKRSTTFWNRKEGLFSTPTIKDASRIEAAYEASDKRRYFVPCPECSEMDHLKWANVKWPDGKPEDAYYVCEECGSVIDESQKAEMLANGEWRATEEFNGIAGFHLNELYSPWVTWGEVAKSFIKAKDSPETLKTWVNTSLGEPWEEAGETVEEGSLMSRREGYPADIPYEALVLTGGIDVQDDRIEFEVKAWGPDEESWAIDYRTIWGKTTENEVWNELDTMLELKYLHECGLQFQVSAWLIDSGFQTQMVYDFVKARSARRIFPTKGVAGSGRPIITAPVKKKGSVKSGKIQPFIIGVDEAKSTIYSRLQRQTIGPGYYHFPVEFEDEYFKQLTAEKAVSKYHKGFLKKEWIKLRPRNEALDINVLCLAGIKLINPNWEVLAARLPAKDSGPKPPKPPSTPAPARQGKPATRRVRSRGFNR